MKTALIAAAVVLGTVINPARAQTAQEKVDMAWAHLERHLNAAPGLSSLSPHVPRGSSYLVVWETYTRVIRRYGLEFYENYPHDPRRLRWLPIAFHHQPRYWLSAKEGAEMYDAARLARDKPTKAIPLDDAARDDWEKRYPVLRAEFLASATVSGTEKVQLKLYEMRRRIYEQTRDADRSVLYAMTNDGRRLREQLQQEIVELGNSPADWKLIDRGESLLELNANTLLDAFWLTGDGRAAHDFVAELGKNRNPVLNQYAAGKVRIMDLTQTPMEGRFVTMDGKEIDLAKLRGKVVLIHYWATDCAGCIGQMPKMKKLYAKHHDNGLEVIGYVFQKPDMKPQIEAVMAKREIPWPQRHDPKLRDDYDRYSFTWVSNLLLLDKGGKLVMHSDGPSEAQLDALIGRELARTL
jgi:thiol-disulfide isomerase/thioredoxin